MIRRFGPSHVAAAGLLWVCGGAFAGDGVECRDGGLEESEACGADENGGCNGTPLAGVAASCGDVWCGASYADQGIRDTDWYVLELADVGGDGVETISASLASQLPGLNFIVSGLESCTPVVEAIGCSEAGTTLIVAESVVPAPALYAVFVAPGACNGTAIFEGYPCGAKVNDYTLSIGCEASTPFCPADVDGNLNVGVLDLVEVIVNWGDCGDPGDCPGDVNGDGTIGVGDLIEVIVNWGPCFGQG